MQWWSKYQQYSNGWFMCYVLCTKLAIWIPDQYLRKQDGIHLSSIQMVELYGIQIALEYRTMTANHSLTFQILSFFI